MVELLSPAGDLEKLKIAYLYGADACYIGGKNFSLRANASNFSNDEIKEACRVAHSLNKRLYVTINIVFHDDDVEGLFEYLCFLEDCGVDAVIVSDPLVIDMIQENNINLEIHFSTQGSTTNKESVKYLMSKGVSRIVLAREVSAYDIRNIIEETGASIEVFLHGAMCTCYSGRCVLSNYFTGRDSNRGGCAQVCRFVFDLDKKRDIQYSIATKDLNLGKEIPKLIEMGVSSLKIEGRMRSIYYIATVISCYRNLIDAYYNNSFIPTLVKKMMTILDRVANRESSNQYFKGNVNSDDQYYIGREEVSNKDFLGIVISYDEDNKMIVLEQRNYFKIGDKVNIFTPSLKEYNFVIDKIYDEEGNLLECARHPKQIVKIPYSEKIEVSSMMRVNFL